MPVKLSELLNLVDKRVKPGKLDECKLYIHNKQKSVVGYMRYKDKDKYEDNINCYVITVDKISEELDISYTNDDIFGTLDEKVRFGGKNYVEKVEIPRDDKMVEININHEIYDRDVPCMETEQDHYIWYDCDKYDLYIHN
tara:strand:- start:606 stop:1025 length:420 start_codon:yes stop_codon:yes gene_type:complete